MKNKKIFRVMGAIASALILVSVFVPYSNLATTALWDMYKETLYYPIVIICFGALGILFFALNIKTEFAYMSAGAILFLVITQTIDAINNNGFSTLGMGYYFLLIGSVLTALMAFICNLRTKVKQAPVNTNIEVNNEPFTAKMDRLYGDPAQTSLSYSAQATNPSQIFQPTINPIEPQQVQPVIPQVQPAAPVALAPPVNSDNLQPIPEINQKPINGNAPNGVVSQAAPQPPIPSITEAPKPIAPMNNLTPQNPVLNEFKAEETNKPAMPSVVPQMDQLAFPGVSSQPQAPVNNLTPQNPVLNEFKAEENNQTNSQPAPAQPVTPQMDQLVFPGVSSQQMQSSNAQLSMPPVAPMPSAPVAPMPSVNSTSNMPPIAPIPGINTTMPSAPVQPQVVNPQIGPIPEMMQNNVNPVLAEFSNTPQTQPQPTLQQNNMAMDMFGQSGVNK